MKIQDKSGMTLVEVMVVVAILLILAAFAAPEAQKAKPNFQLRSLAHDVLATMQRARSLAVQKNTSVRVDFSADGYQLIEDVDKDGEFQDNDRNSSPPKVIFADYGQARSVGGGRKCGNDTTVPTGVKKNIDITFTSRGTANSGTIYLDNGLTDNENQHCYEIGSLSTGSVKLEKK